MVSVPKVRYIEMYEFKSCFAWALRGVLDTREVLGYSIDPYRKLFASFDLFCSEEHPDETILTETLVMSWVIKTKENGGGVRRRAAAVRMLGRYILSSGGSAYILPDRYFGAGNSKELFIFSDDALARLFSAIDHLAESEKVPYSNLILPVLFRLIYTCGLRPKEGRDLRRRHIDLETGEILITSTKKKRERIVVMSDSMLSLCRRYEQMRQFFYEDNEYFFPGSSTGPVDGAWVSRQFTKCWILANPDVPKEKLARVRVYDLRHRFASCNINRWLDEGKDLMAMIPRLRAYMGHVNISETAHYIHLLPENLIKSKGIDWASFSGIIPEVPE